MSSWVVLAQVGESGLKTLRPGMGVLKEANELSLDFCIYQLMDKRTVKDLNHRKLIPEILDNISASVNNGIVSLKEPKGTNCRVIAKIHGYEKVTILYQGSRIPGLENVDLGANPQNLKGTYYVKDGNYVIEFTGKVSDWSDALVKTIETNVTILDKK